ncbi:hypothetical protein [Spiroplasma endosymbiont of Nephrotoma flavescens]|uniref:hypothetical protein n=1 Tax=Spiroplasma endosymbiont of Nephrotoma flavescens TaxID=3066302 RepID=UPI00313C7422
MNTKVLARYFSALCIINNGLNWWKRFSYDWIGLFSQDKLDNGDEIKFHYVSAMLVILIELDTTLEQIAEEGLIQIVPFTEKTAEQNWLRKTYDKSQHSFYSHNSVANPQHYFLNNNDVSLSCQIVKLSATKLFF